MVELLQGIVTLIKDFGIGVVSSAGAVILIYLMRKEIKDINKKHVERFDILHENYKNERVKTDEEHRAERMRIDEEHRKERELDRRERELTREVLSKNVDMIHGQTVVMSEIGTFIRAKLA